MHPNFRSIYCATANLVEVVVAQTEGGRGILGVIDGAKIQSVESDADIAACKAMLRKFGHKLV